MVFNEFFNHYSDINTKKSQVALEKELKTFTNQVKSFIIEEGISFNELTNDALDKLFNSEEKIDKFFKTKLTSSNKCSIHLFQTTRRYLTALLLWFKSNNLCDINDNVIKFTKDYNYNNILTADFFASYFKNLNDVIDFIDLVGKTQFKEARKINKRVDIYEPSRDLLAVKSLCILLWYGFNLEEISNIKKSDLKSSNDYYYVEYNNKRIKIPYSQFKILSNLRDSTGEHSISRPINFARYMDGDTLFRKKHDFITGETTKHRMKSLSHTITGFNKIAIKLNAPKLLNAKNLKVNSYFVTAYVNISKFDKASVTKYFYDNFHTATTAYDYVLQFMQWVKVFYNIEIK